MESSIRIFYCTYCQDQITICSYCDRGNIYCQKCAPLARANSKKEIAKRYQNTKKGKHKHAARQATYRSHKKSDASWLKFFPSHDLLPTESNIVAIVTNNSFATTKKNLICDFCSN
jgi:hypothetical protein